MMNKNIHIINALKKNGTVYYITQWKTDIVLVTNFKLLKAQIKLFGISKNEQTPKYKIKCC